MKPCEGRQVTSCPLHSIHDAAFTPTELCLVPCLHLFLPTSSRLAVGLEYSTCLQLQQSDEQHRQVDTSSSKWILPLGPLALLLAHNALERTLQGKESRPFIEWQSFHSNDE